MYAAIDFTADMVSYSYFDGSEVVTDTLRNTIGFRTPDLFRDDGAMGALVRVVKDMIEFTIGGMLSDIICTVPAYCSYMERERLKKAASVCGMNVKKVIRGSMGSAFQLFQKSDPVRKTVVLCSIHSNYGEILVYKMDGDVLQVTGSTVVQFEPDAAKEDKEKTQQRIRSELKALYSENSMSFGEKDETIYVSCDENVELIGELFAVTLEECIGKSAVTFQNAPSTGAFYHLMKTESYESDRIRKCFSVDCCTEGISIVSGVNDELKEVFKRNTPLPAQNTVDLMISYDNILCFYAGNYVNRQYDEPIGTCRIPEAYRGQKIHVKITLNEEATIEYAVLDASKQIIYPRRALS